MALRQYTLAVNTRFARHLPLAIDTVTWANLFTQNVLRCALCTCEFARTPAFFASPHHISITFFRFGWTEARWGPVSVDGVKWVVYSNLASTLKRKSKNYAVVSRISTIAYLLCERRATCDKCEKGHTLVLQKMYDEDTKKVACRHVCAVRLWCFSLSPFFCLWKRVFLDMELLNCEYTNFQWQHKMRRKREKQHFRRRSLIFSRAAVAFGYFRANVLHVAFDIICAPPALCCARQRS